MADDRSGRFSSTALDSVLDALLEDDPPPHVVAIDAKGFFIPMPPSVPVKDGRLIEGRTSALDLFIAADAQAIIETWECALRVGVSNERVHLLSNPSECVTLHFIDARYRYGVLLGLIVGVRATGTLRAGAESTLRPRVWMAKKDKLAVITDVEPAVRQILGWDPAEMIGRRSLEFIHPDDQPRAISNYLAMLSSRGGAHRVRLRHKHRDGSWVWFEFSNENLLEDPAQRCVRSEMVNISDEMAALEALRSSEQLLRRLAEALPLGVVQIDGAGRVIYRNRRLGTIVGNEFAATIEEQLAGVIPDDREILAKALRAVGNEGQDGDVEVTLSRDGDLRCCSVSLRALKSDKGEPSGAIICISDVTDRTRMREELEIRATYDALTGCHNRASILAVLERTVLEARSAGGCGPAVLFVDLDQFKDVNDRWGHAAGDELLRRVSERLMASARSTDIVGRFGGDEFLIVCPRVAGVAQARAIGERVAAALIGAIEIGAARLEQKASIGVAWTSTLTDAEALVAAADAAMYDSKREARGRPVVSHRVPRPSCRLPQPA